MVNPNRGGRNAVVLLLESDPGVRDMLASALERDRLIVHTAADGRSGLQLFYSRRPDVVALDVELPELDGWSVLERIRELSSVPVIALTPGENGCCVRALRDGADDCVPRSVPRAELEARIHALLRRTAPATDEREIFDDGLLHIDHAERRAAARGVDLGLTPREFSLLWKLTANAGVLLSRPQLLDAVWGDPVGDPHRVTLYVGYLREKLRKAASIDPIETVRAFGYRYLRQE
jgi:DNA-binding response OmpR family regulator